MERALSKYESEVRDKGRAEKKNLGEQSAYFRKLLEKNKQRRREALQNYLEAK